MSKQEPSGCKPFQLSPPYLEEADENDHVDLSRLGQADATLGVFVDGQVVSLNDVIQLDWLSYPAPKERHELRLVKRVSKLNRPLLFTIPNEIVRLSVDAQADVSYTVIKSPQQLHSPWLRLRFSHRETSKLGPANDSKWLILGARGQTHGFAEQNRSRLTCISETTREPVSVHWRYEGDAHEVYAHQFRDSEPWRLLKVSTEYQSDTLLPCKFATSKFGSTPTVALNNRGAVVSWGSDDLRPIEARQATDGLALHTNIIANALLHTCGRITYWPTANFKNLARPVIDVNDCIEIVSNAYAIAALRRTGQVTAWGLDNYGGLVPSVINAIQDAIQLFANEFAFAVLRSTGQIACWGETTYGGSLSNTVSQLDDVISLAYGTHTFAALRDNGKVHAWGYPQKGGLVPDHIQQLSDIVSVTGNANAFAVQRRDGQILAWGNPKLGGLAPTLAPSDGKIINTVGNHTAFAGVTDKGRVIAWGESTDGGKVPEDIARLNNIVQVTSSQFAFAALCNDGKVVSWGRESHCSDKVNIRSQLNDICAVYGNPNGFTALARDGRVICWGDTRPDTNPAVLLTGQVSYLANADELHRQQLASARQKLFSA